MTSEFEVQHPNHLRPHFLPRTLAVLSINPLNPKSEASNFSLESHYLMKHTSHENKGDDHQR